MFEKAFKFCGHAYDLNLLRPLAWHITRGLTLCKHCGRSWCKIVFLLSTNWTRGFPRVWHWPRGSLSLWPVHHAWAQPLKKHPKHGLYPWLKWHPKHIIWVNFDTLNSDNWFFFLYQVSYQGWSLRRSKPILTGKAVKTGQNWFKPVKTWSKPKTQEHMPRVVKEPY